jgi:inosose dehydratase
MASIIAVGSYQWYQFYGRKDQTIAENLDEVLGWVKDAGFDAWEPTLGGKEEMDALAEGLARHGLVSPSAYWGGTYHLPEWKRSVDEAAAKVSDAKALGLKILVCNPDPIDWGNPQDKSDDQLRTQGKALAELTLILKEMGVTLAYHVHTPELRQGAREMHHMMLATKEAGMGFCLDTHWIYRATGNSQVALEDVVTMYADRVVSTHIRQSHGGVWSETLGEGDIDHDRIFAQLKGAGFSGPQVAETAFEEGTPETMPISEAYKISGAWLRSKTSG